MHAECAFMHNRKQYIHQSDAHDRFGPIKIYVMYCSLHLQPCPTPASQRPLMFADLIWPCGQIEQLTRRKAANDNVRTSYLERRFMSRTFGCRLRVCVREMRLNPRNEYGKSTLCRWHQATPSPRIWGYRSRTAKRKIQAPWLTDRAQWVTAVRPMDAASELFASVALCQEKVPPSQNGPVMVRAIPHWAGTSAGSVVQQGKADECMNGGEAENGGSAVSAAGIHRSVTCRLIT